MSTVFAVFAFFADVYFFGADFEAENRHGKSAKSENSALAGKSISP